MGGRPVNNSLVEAENAIAMTAHHVNIMKSNCPTLGVSVHPATYKNPPRLEHPRPQTLHLIPKLTAHPKAVR